MKGLCQSFIGDWDLRSPIGGRKLTVKTYYLVVLKPLIIFFLQKLGPLSHWALGNRPFKHHSGPSLMLSGWECWITSNWTQKDFWIWFIVSNWEKVGDPPEQDESYVWFVLPDRAMVLTPRRDEFFFFAQFLSCGPDRALSARPTQVNPFLCGFRIFAFYAACFYILYKCLLLKTEMIINYSLEP